MAEEHIIDGLITQLITTVYPDTNSIFSSQIFIENREAIKKDLKKTLTDSILKHSVKTATKLSSIEKLPEYIEFDSFKYNRKDYSVCVEMSNMNIGYSLYQTPPVNVPGPTDYIRMNIKPAVYKTITTADELFEALDDFDNLEFTSNIFNSFYGSENNDAYLQRVLKSFIKKNNIRKLIKLKLI